MRLPLAPMISAAGGLEHLARACGYANSDEMGSRTNLWNWVKNGVAWPVADRLACAVNLHPSSVWGEAWFECAGPVQGPRSRFPGREPRWGQIRAEMEAVA